MNQTIVNWIFCEWLWIEYKTFLYTHNRKNVKAAMLCHLRFHLYVLFRTWVLRCTTRSFAKTLSISLCHFYSNICRAAFAECKLRYILFCCINLCKHILKWIHIFYINEYKTEADKKNNNSRSTSSSWGIWHRSSISDNIHTSIRSHYIDDDQHHNVRATLLNAIIPLRVNQSLGATQHPSQHPTIQ